MKNAMNKKNGGSNPHTTFKTPQVAVEEHDKILEKRKNLLNERRKSTLNTIINNPNLQETTKETTEKVIDQQNYNAKIYQLLNQIENDNKIRYAQINQRISKFETILGEISLIMHDLNETPMSIQNMEHAG